MIEKIIENWLDKSSERSYQIPFCYLLVQQGYTIIHMTRHCGMEHGKDIIALDKKGDVHTFQLKGVNGGKLGISDWQNGVQAQMVQSIFTPVTHPSIKTTRQHRSWLVINGDLQEEVQHAIFAHNTNWEKKGKPEYKIETIVKGQMLAWALKVKKYFIPAEFQEFNSLLAFYLEDGTGFLDKSKFSDLLHSVLLKPNKTAAEARRVISSCALLCSLALSSFENKQNHFSVAEGWTICLSEIFWYAETNKISGKDYESVFELTDQIILSTLENLYEEIVNHKDLLLPSLALDIFIVGYRITILMGLMAYLGYRRKLHNLYPGYFTGIDQFIQENKQAVFLWGESAIPYLINVYWFYKIYNEPDKSLHPLQSLLVTLLKAGENSQANFTNVYLSAEESAVLKFDTKLIPEEKLKYISTNHVIQSVIHLCAINNMKQLLVDLWKNIGTCRYVDFEYEQPADFYLWRARSGKEITNYEKPNRDWNELVREATLVDNEMVPQRFAEFPYFVPLFLTVYPHRLRRNIVMWFDKTIQP